MKNHKFTIVIPTRERADTLFHSLKTCIAQNYDNLTILVSDNASLDNTRDVVHSFDDPRIKYVNTGKRVGMSENWEFALAHVNEGYVGMLGDDDGYLIDGIEGINQVLNEHPAKAINWLSDNYTWPSFVFNKPNHLIIKYPREGVRRLDTKKELLSTIDALHGHTNYCLLPWIYRSFADMEAIKDVKRKSKSGRFVNSCSPDVYSGMALAAVMDDYVFSEKPFALIGSSGKSVGASFTYPNVSASESNKFLIENAIKYPDNIPQVPSSPIITIECFIQARENGLFDESFYHIDYKELIEAAIKELVKEPVNRYESVTKGMFQLAQLNGVPADFVQEMINKYPHKPLNFKADYIVNGYNLVEKRIEIDGNKCGLENIYDAVLMHHQVLSNPEPFLKPTKVAISTMNFLLRAVKKRYAAG